MVTAKKSKSADQKPAKSQELPAVLEPTVASKASQSTGSAAPAKRAPKRQSSASKSAVNGPEKKAAKAPVEPEVVKKVRVKKTVAPAEPEMSAPALPTPKVEPQLENKLANEPPKALRSPIRIFQIYFEGWQRELLDPAFYPLDNSRGNSELLEFAVFDQLARNPATQDAQLWGALSWRFGEKTGMLGADLVKQIVDHPGYDVYSCNPHPSNEAIYHNMWMQGEVSHPQFLEIVRAFYVAAGLNEKELIQIEPSSGFAAANYFVATPAFWQKYIAFVRRALVTADKRLDPRIRDLLHSKVADDKGLHGGATYVPFIVERLFATFLRTEGNNFKAYKVALPERERELNVHQKLLREMKDVACKTKSAWLAACWVNYRNLYLSQANGKEWCEKYLRAITPAEVLFA